MKQPIFWVMLFLSSCTPAEKTIIEFRGEWLVSSIAVIALLALWVDSKQIKKLMDRVTELEKKVADLNKRKAYDNWSGQYKDDDKNKPQQ